MRKALSLTRLTLWQWVFVLLMIGGAYAAYVRVFYGLGASTHLNDGFPWGLWIGFDILCGVGLAAGGFTLAAIVHIFNIERYKPVLRPAILTAFLGYVLVVVALLFDLGRPYRLWHPLVMWNPHSVMFEVAWCVMLYTTVLALEFAPAVLERYQWKRALKVVHAVSIPLVILGVILSTLHQSSLGSLYLIVPEKLYPLWYTPLLPVFFFVSAVCVGFAMTIFESWHSSRAFHRQLEAPLLASMGRVLAVLLMFYLVDAFSGPAASERSSPAAPSTGGDVPFLSRDRLDGRAHGALVSAAGTDQPDRAVLLRDSGDLWVYHPPAERERDWSRGGFGNALRAQVDRGGCSRSASSRSASPFSGLPPRISPSSRPRRRT